MLLDRARPQIVTRDLKTFSQPKIAEEDDTRSLD